MPEALNDLKILVVEDDFFLALSLTEALTAMGAEVLGPESRRSPALAVAQRAELGGAVLDVKLDGDTTEDVAAVLIERGVPLIFVTGYADEDLPVSLRGVTRLTKPVDAQSLQRVAVQCFTSR